MGKLDKLEKLVMGEDCEKFKNFKNSAVHKKEERGKLQARKMCNSGGFKRHSWLIKKKQISL